MLVNRKAQGVTEASLAQLRDAVGERLYITETLDEAKLAARRIVDSGVAALAIGGGDGTFIQAVADLVATGEGPYSIAAASTIHSYSNGMNFFPHAEAMVGTFQVRISALTGVETLVALQRSFDGTFRHPELHDFAATAIAFELAPSRRKDAACDQRSREGRLLVRAEEDRGSHGQRSAVERHRARLRAVAGKVQACFAGTQGHALVRLTVAPSGQVQQVTVLGRFAGTPVGACVERAVRTATFSPWDRALQRFGYDYLLSD